MKGLPDQREHRTAVIIDVRLGVSPAYRDRYTRLLQTFAHPNAMQVDVYTLGGNLTNDGPGLSRCIPENYVPPAQPPQIINLEKWANMLGYDTTIYVRPTPKECK